MTQLRSAVNRLSHTIKLYLARHTSIENLRIAAFVVSLLSCVSAGLILLFSLFLIALHDSFGVSYLHINYISLVSAIGMYFCLPVLGYLADMHGTSLLALLLLWFFIPSYYACARIVQVQEPLSNPALVCLGACFFFIGLGTLSLYFLSLLTCAKIYPNYKGLAISLPVLCYGLLLLILLQLIKHPWFHHREKLYSQNLDLFKVFSFFTYMYLVVVAFNFIAASVVSIESEVIFEHDHERCPHNELLPLLQESAENADDASETSDTFLPHREIIEPENHATRYFKFLKDPLAWLLLVSLVANLGPMESFQNNLASIVQFVDGKTADPATNVAYLAAALTVTRLIAGVLSDFLALPKRNIQVCRVWILALVIFIGAVGQLPSTSTHANGLTWMLILSGISYGGLFTIYPAIIASVWGVDILGLTWGSFMVAPAIGSVGFSLLYGTQSDSKCTKGASADCLLGYLTVTSTSLLFSLVVVMITWRCIWSKRGLKVF